MQGLESKKDIVIGLMLFVLEIVLFYYLWKNNIALTTALILMSIFILLKWTSKEEKFIYFVAFFLGPIVDLTLVPTAIWSYGNPTIFRVPLWLPLGYGIGAVIMIKLGKSIAKII